jgi:hypothetical protein
VSNTRNSDVPLTGIAIGAVVLALFVVFAVLLPKAEGDDANTSRVVLPNSLPGGYLAADQTAAWKGASSSVAGHEAEVAAQVRSELKFGDSALEKTTNGGFGNRIYLKKGAQAIFFVQVFRAEGGAFSPGEISDPSKLQQNSSVQQLTKVGDSTCIVDGTVGTGGQVQPNQTQCQRTKGGLTVQVTAPSVAASDVAKVADLVLAQVH